MSKLFNFPTLAIFFIICATQLECLAINYCHKVNGSSFRILFQRCRKLKCLLAQQTGTSTVILLHSNLSS